MHLFCLSPQFAFSFFLTKQNYCNFLPTYEVMYFKPFLMLFYFIYYYHLLFRILEIFACKIRTPETVCLCNPESYYIHNPSSTYKDWNPVMQNPRRTNRTFLEPQTPSNLSRFSNRSVSANNYIYMGHRYTYSTGSGFKICLRARNVSGPFEKWAPSL